MESNAADPRVWRIMDELTEVAKELNVSCAQVALQWVRARGAIPIIGARTMKQLLDNVAAYKVVLTKDHMKKLNEASALPSPYPYFYIDMANK